jgi:DNA primase
MRLGLFGKGAAEKAKGADKAARIKTDVRALLALPEAAAIAVNEILCADPACPGTETVILVMTPGEKTKAFKAQMAMAELTREALAAVLAADS